MPVVTVLMYVPWAQNMPYILDASPYRGGVLFLLTLSPVLKLRDVKLCMSAKHYMVPALVLLRRRYVVAHTVSGEYMLIHSMMIIILKHQHLSGSFHMSVMLHVSCLSEMIDDLNRQDEAYLLTSRHNSTMQVGSNAHQLSGLTRCSKCTCLPGLFLASPNSSDLARLGPSCLLSAETCKCL